SPSSKFSKKRANKDNTTVIVSKNKWTSHVLQEIKHLRRTTHFLIPKQPFARLVREIIIDIFPRQNITSIMYNEKNYRSKYESRWKILTALLQHSIKIQATALEALQEATEMYIVQFFEDSVLLTLHAKRVTLMRNDMILMRRLRGRNDIINR
ncbi:Histone H3, partial [Trachymyrmex zeteki]